MCMCTEALNIMVAGIISYQVWQYDIETEDGLLILTNASWIR